MEEGRVWRRHELALLIAWQTHQLLAAQADATWHSKYGSFQSFLEFFKPPYVLAEDKSE